MIDLCSYLPPMLYGKELDEALTVLPPYAPNIVHADTATRLVALSDIYRVFLSNAMSREIYAKLYLGLLRSLQKKGSQLVPRQYVENQKAIQMEASAGILGGADSFTIIGASGIGKSSSISRSIQLISKTPIIVTDKPYMQVIPCVMVQTPFDASVKGLLLEILRAVDAKLGSDYCAKAMHSRNTTVDTLIGCVASVCINHIGLLVIDEIQHIVGQKAGDALARCLMQIINSSGISIALVGTPSVIPFLSDGEYQLARRSLGLYYEPMEYDLSFQNLCTTLYRYQYVKSRTELDESMMRWLYEHCSGNPSVLVSLLHDAQECSILDGQETISYDSLNTAYNKRLRMLHPHIKTTRKPSTSKVKQEVVIPKAEPIKTMEEFSIVAIVKDAKKAQQDIVSCLKRHFSVEEVRI